MITQNITLDLSQKSPYQYLYTKQGDDQSRYVCVRLTHGGKDYCPVGVTANLRARKPDGTMVLNPATVNEDGTVTLELTKQLLAVSGPVLADVCLCGSEGEILSTVSFVIHVDTAPSGEKMDSTSEFLTLMELVGRVEGTLTTDRTLRLSDRAADAKATGDRFTAQQGLVDGVSAGLRQVEVDLNVERQRISQLASLEEGSTTGDAELQDIRVGWDGTTHESAGEAVRAVGALAGALPQFRYIPDSEVYSRLTVNLVEDGFYSAPVSAWDDLPCGDAALLVFQYSANYVLQVAFARTGGELYWRIVNIPNRQVFSDWRGTVPRGGGLLGDTTTRYNITDTTGLLSFNVGADTTGGAGIWLYGNDHAALGFARIQVYDPDTQTHRRFDVRRDGTIAWNNYILPSNRPSLDSAEYDRLTAKLAVPGYYHIDVTQWDDFPFERGGALVVFQYGTNYSVQIAVSTTGGDLLTRIVHRTDFTVSRDWEYPDGTRPVKVLALGDSVCKGARNGGRGFVGDLGLPYKNIGVSGATLSNRVTGATNIPDQLVNETEYTPDVIIANGGVNDFTHNVPLGPVPSAPATTDTEAEALDRDTVLGGLGYLFYKMIALHPNAQRFFLLPHKTKAELNGAVVDWTVTGNTAGYTQADLCQAIEKVCGLYGVKVIDVYGESMIHTAFEVYKSEVAYSEDNSVTDGEFVDADGIHPLAYGYRHGYAPLVKQALRIGTGK